MWRYPFSVANDLPAFDPAINSCSRHTGQSGLQVIITMKLNKPVLVDAVLIIGENTASRHLSEFNIFVGMSTDHNENTACPNGPFALSDGNYGNYDP